MDGETVVPSPQEVNPQKEPVDINAISEWLME